MARNTCHTINIKHTKSTHSGCHKAYGSVPPTKSTVLLVKARVTPLKTVSQAKRLYIIACMLMVHSCAAVAHCCCCNQSTAAPIAAQPHNPPGCVSLLLLRCCCCKLRPRLTAGAPLWFTLLLLLLLRQYTCDVVCDAPLLRQLPHALHTRFTSVLGRFRCCIRCCFRSRLHFC